MQNYSTFTLFECRKPLTPKSVQTSEPLQDEHVLLDDNKYIADVLFEIKNAKGAKVHSSGRRVGCRARNRWARGCSHGGVQTAVWG